MRITHDISVTHGQAAEHLERCLFFLGGGTRSYGNGLDKTEVRLDESRCESVKEMVQALRRIINE